MKIPILSLALFVTLTLPISAQEDVSGIFDDLGDLEAISQSTTLTVNLPKKIPALTPAPLTVQSPQQESPILHIERTASSSPIIEQKEPTPNLDIDTMLDCGKEAYGDNNWDRARQQFAAVLYADPSNKKAIRWLHRTADKKSKLESKHYDATRTDMLANVQAAWNTPKLKGTPNFGLETAHELTETEHRIKALQAKLQNIQIPAIAFQNSDIQQVVLELSALCRKLDGTGQGINLVTFGTSETLLAPVTFSGTKLSALEALDIITQMSGMKYDIGPNMVSLTPVNYEPPQQMVSADFDVQASVGTKMTIMTGDQAGPSGLLDVRGFFSTIPFPTGSSAQYNPEFNLLLVHNSPKHIAKVEALLQRYNQKALEERSRQVEIETKFIEVSEGALEELGFEWTFGTAGEHLNNDTWVVAGGQKLFTDTLRTSEEALKSGVRTANRATSFNTLASVVSDPTGTDLIGTAGELLVQKITGTKINLLIRALERQAGSDVLSAPKVLAKSGETASIHVGEVRRFPTAYDVIIERYAQPSLLPLDYEEYKTGVMLEVTPALDPEHGTIDLDLSPEIRELAGYDEQHVGTLYPNADFDLGSQEEKPGYGLEYIDYLVGKDENTYRYSDRLIARQPVFKTRKVETSVTIEDGSTIAMGGLIKEKMETFKDSVPILGKIPFIGRFFRSEGEQMVKRNLIIFVSANQVDATGYKNVRTHSQHPNS